MLEQVVAVVIRALGKSKKTAPNVLEILLDCLKGKSRETPRLCVEVKSSLQLAFRFSSD
jgi:hypothetical protein